MDAEMSIFTICRSRVKKEREKERDILPVLISLQFLKHTLHPEWKIRPHHGLL